MTRDVDEVGCQKRGFWFGRNASTNAEHSQSPAHAARRRQKTSSTDRCGTVSCCSGGKHKRHVQVLADPAGRLIWISPALPGARHDMGTAREHDRLTALEVAGVWVIADNAYRGAGANVEVPHRRPPRDPDTGERHRRLSANEKAVNSAHARLRGPGERANAQLKPWRILPRVRSSPRRATRLVDAIRSVIHTS